MYTKRHCRTSLILFIVSPHLSTSFLVCSYAASRSSFSCERCGSGAGNGCDFAELDETDLRVLSSEGVVLERGFIRSLKESFDDPKSEFSTMAS